MAASNDPLTIHVELCSAIQQLRVRSLHHSVQWATDQLVGLPEHVWEPGAAEAAKLQAQSVEPEHPKLIQGRCYFELKEYTRAAHSLSGLNTPLAVFLRCYALFLAGEKQKEQDRVEASGPLGTATTTNPHLDVVASELSAAEAGGLSDPFTLYLAAVVDIERGDKVRARELLVKSLHAFPCHWGSWEALVGCCDDLECVGGLGLPSHWTCNFFLAKLCLELQANAEALSRLQLMNQMFPGSDWVTCNAALAHYNLRNYPEAQQLYEDLLAKNPWILQGMDVYSNILFVQESFGPLSHLAHRLATTDKYTPEACCVIGNYYSLKGHHERSVEWFRRALRLCRTYLSAWTLMGHEYVEMKNAPAAIDAYRNAVALNPRDFRAWYGLGQTYELLTMPHYAIHYYRRAALLLPTDARMWIALGACYEAEGLAMPGLAMRCYRRALMLGDKDGIGLAKLAQLHVAGGDRAAAAHYYAVNLARLDAEGAGGTDATDALLFLAEYAKDCGMLAEAEGYCQRLMDVAGPANMRAKAILRDIRSSSNAPSSSGGINTTAAVAVAVAAASGTAGTAAGTEGPGSSSGRMALGARRVLGDAGGVGGGPGPWVTSSLGQQQQQQRQQQQGGFGGLGFGAAVAPGNMGAAGLQPQQTPGAFSMVMEDDDEDDDMALLTGGVTPASQQYQQQQQQGLPPGIGDAFPFNLPTNSTPLGTTGSTPGGMSTSMSLATPSLTHLLRHGFPAQSQQQQSQQQQLQQGGNQPSGAGGQGALNLNHLMMGMPPQQPQVGVGAGASAGFTTASAVAGATGGTGGGSSLLTPLSVLTTESPESMMLMTGLPGIGGDGGGGSRAALSMSPPSGFGYGTPEGAAGAGQAAGDAAALAAGATHGVGSRGARGGATPAGRRGAALVDDGDDDGGDL